MPIDVNVRMEGGEEKCVCAFIERDLEDNFSSCNLKVKRKKKAKKKKREKN